MNMTCNQMIVLLDVRRGFNPSRHSGTLKDDLRSLDSEGLIMNAGSVEWVLTAKGDSLFEAWKMCARGLR